MGPRPFKPENYVGELPPAEPAVGDEWTDIGVTGEQVRLGRRLLGVYHWRRRIDPDVVRDRVDDPGLYNQQLCRVIDSETGEGEWVISSGGEGKW